MGQMYDYPNKQAVGLDPPWVEGTGGPGDATPAPQADTGQQAASGRSSGDLDGMTKEELLAHAQDIGASPANAGMNKDELRDSIDRKRNEG
jgi:hypothetical protein